MANKMELTPIMSLSLLVLFLMMVPLFSLANNKNKTGYSQAASQRPTPTPEMMME
jgi:hypothetical protein